MEPENKGALDFSKALANPRPDAQHINRRQGAGNEPSAPKMIQWVIRHSGGLVQSEKQASWVLLGFVVAAVMVSLFLVFGGLSQNNYKGRMVPPGPAPAVNLYDQK